ncbi:MAG: hypothetical protein ACERKD_08805 [Prolixibacteraceae bacterium]
MKKIIIIIGIVFSIASLAQDSNFSIPLKNWNIKIVGLDNYYPTYLADPLGVKFQVLSQNMVYSDFEHQDKVNAGGDYSGKLTVSPGARISLLKFASKKNPNLGFEFDLGMQVPMVMRAGNHDLIESDGIYYFALAGRPTDWLALRFSKHHICTHIGDEFSSGIVQTPVDYDPNITQLPVRDDFILSAAVKPLYFLGNPKLDILQVYGDFGFFLPGVDFMGRRQNKPNRTAYLNLQGGAELEYYFNHTYLGGVYSGINVSSYQLNAFSPNISFSAGYIVPQERNKKKVRFGFNYYNGRSLSNQFYNRKEKSLSFSLAVDI